jgi:hypothetical protein
MLSRLGFEDEFGTSLKTTAIHAGNLNFMKADNILLLGCEVSNLPDYFHKGGERSVREQNIEGFKRLYEEVLQKTSGFIVEISDKSYNLKSASFKEKGFGAQDSTLENFEAVLKKMDVKEKELENIIFVLSNYGPDLIEDGKKAEEVCKYLATLIAYFVFDDIDFDKDLENLNAIHIFNLNGVYVPLSSFL